MVVQVVQAMNRIQCRKVIDELGNCAPTDFFIRLPADSTGEEVLNGIKRSMPGIKVVAWDLEAVKKRAKPSRLGPQVVSYASALPPGSRVAAW